MKPSWEFFLGFFVLLLCGCAGIDQRNQADANPYTIAVGADPQLFMRQKDDSLWQKTIDQIIDVQPDFFIVCGDLINAPNRAAKWDEPKRVEEIERQAKAYLSGAKRLKKHLPVYNVAGNHDVSLSPTPERLSWYEDKFGKPWYSFEHKNSLYVVLESNLLRDPSGAPLHAEKQLNWLDGVLKKAKKKNYDHKFAFMHHPLCLKDLNEKDSYHNIRTEMRKRLVSSFLSHDFSAIFSGHLHKNNYMQIENMKMITTTSCCVPFGKNPRGVHLVKINPESFSYEYVPLEK
jgi:serine/threonine-protein phosphatase CPPED1